MKTSTRTTRLIATMGLVIACLAPATVLAQHEEHHEGAPAGEHGTPHEAGHEHAEEHHEVESVNWVSFDKTRKDAHGVEKPNPPPFAASIVNFLILAGIVAFGISKGINPALATRRKVIETELGEAQRLRAEAEALHQEYSDKVAAMTDEFAKLKQEYIDAGKAEAARVIKDAESKSERMRQDAETQISAEIRQLRVDLIREAVDAAVQSAEASVRKSVQSSDQTRLVDDFIGALEREAASNKKGAPA